MKYKMIIFIIYYFFLTLCGCGPDVHDRENYGNLGQNPKSIILDQPQNHMGGYGRNECLVCHNAALNIHRRPGSMINIEELNQQIRANGEAKYCLTCHGQNGLNSSLQEFLISIETVLPNSKGQ